jgi:hypothetical protein
VPSAISIRSVVGALTFVIAVHASSRVEAQQSSQLKVGAKIRVYQHKQKPFTARFERLDADSISYLDSKKSDGPASVSRNEVYKVQVASRNHPLGALKFSLLGLGIGAVGGAVFGAAAYDNECDIMVCSRGSAAALAGTVIGALGFATGLIGGAIGGTETWHDVPMHSTPLR